MRGYRQFGFLKDRLLVFIGSLYLVGMIFGVFIIRGNKITLTGSANFLSVFFANYWYLFLLWIFGFSFSGLFFDSIIIFFRGFLFGSMMTILIPEQLNRAGMMVLLELLLFLPAFFTLSYVSMQCSWNAFNILFSRFQRAFNIKLYLNLMLAVTAVVIVYSIIIVING